MPNQHKLKWISRGLFLGLAMMLGACAISAAAGGTEGKPKCNLGEPVETDGYRRLALIVAVGQYKSDQIPDLEGPTNDARRIYELLTGKNGYGFPQENVCMLFDEEATTNRFKEKFDQSLIDRARKRDVAVFYYAGHGSQARDTNRDEPDEQDETFLLHDARTDGAAGTRISDLRDDELNGLLVRLHEKTHNITVILDSCNSGTATRGDAGTMVARFVEPAPDVPAEVDAPGDSGGEWAPESLPGLVVFTAASDGTQALEESGHGIFTDAVYQVLSRTSPTPLTFTQAARQIPALVAARSYQIPYFQGDLSGPVFGNTARTQPMGWEVIATGPPIKLGGPPMPGLGRGAELRIYDGAATGVDTRDPAKAKATVIVDDMTGLNATAHASASRPGSPKIVAGDLAIPVRPADEFLRIKMRIKPPREPGGVPVNRANLLRKAIAQDPETKMLVELTTGAGDFELGLSSDGALQLRGPENRVRNTFIRDEDVVQSLWQHARQKALLQLQGEGGDEFTDGQTLQVQLRPAAKQDQCSRGTWEQAKPNQEQVIPLCLRWNVHAALAENAPTPLLVGGVILSTDGSSFGIPNDGRKVLLRPGQEVTFTATNETFRGTPPLDVRDHVMVFGTKEKNPVAWHLLTSPARTRAAGPPKSALSGALDRYLTGTRGTAREEENAEEDSTWTLSLLPMRVEANTRFLKGGQSTSEPIRTREYTIKRFDIRPYLPDDENLALYKVLEKANWLAQASAEDGFGFKQHDWTKPTDAENLKLGIDCSRAIWFAFTRSGLPYNRSNRFLNTAMMVAKDSRMADKFNRCDNGDLNIGDVLVYRDPERGDGHAVMVIDPIKRFAWGSHGYDGNAKELKTSPDTGVEYQLIKYKKDWERWDRSTMRRMACWRYRNFSKEMQTGHGLPGTKALVNVCNVDRRCGH